MEILLAIVLGTLFGFALNRAGATNPNKIINMLRLTDTHLMKVILFAIGFSSILLFIGINLGIIDAGHLSIKTAYTGVIIGGALLGIGFAISGYCPGTGITAAATGRSDAWVFVAGGLVGALGYMLTYDYLKDTFLMNKIAGGAAMLADAGIEQHTALLGNISGTLVAVTIGVLFIAIAKLLPEKIL